MPLPLIGRPLDPLLSRVSDANRTVSLVVSILCWEALCWEAIWTVNFILRISSPKQKRRERSCFFGGIV